MKLLPAKIGLCILLCFAVIVSAGCSVNKRTRVSDTQNISSGAHTHTFTETVTVQPECTKCGEKICTCQCGAQYKMIVPATGHKISGGRCENCGMTFKPVNSLSQWLFHFHKWDSGAVTSIPTCMKKGETVYTCTECGMQKSRSLGTAGHDYINGVCFWCGRNDPGFESSEKTNVTPQTPAASAEPAPTPTPTPPLPVDSRGNFEMYGQTFNINDTYIDLRKIPVDDNAAAVESMLAFMPNLKTLDMDNCGVDSIRMAQIRDANPNIEVVWRVYFGTGYSVRTNVEKILASYPAAGGSLTSGNCTELKYCTKVKYLDIGHNGTLTDISFVSHMPDLEVLIAAMAQFSDLTPLAGCKKLEFLEIQTTQVTDLSPLSELHNLKHLNIAYNFSLSDITPLYGLVQLERLWIGVFDPVPNEQVENMHKRAQLCQINTTAVDPHEGWRYDIYGQRVERYALLAQQLGYDTRDYSLSERDIYYTMPAGAIEHN